MAVRRLDDVLAGTCDRCESGDVVNVGDDRYFCEQCGLVGEIANSATTNDPLVKLRLVPVEVFGADDGYGLSDAVSAWSDCNRARGHIYRVDDLDPEGQYRKPGESVEIWVRASDVAFFERAFGDDR